MKQFLLKFFSFVLFLFVMSCSNNEERVLHADSWFDSTKVEILKQSKHVPDSTVFTFNEDSTFVQKHSFFVGKEFLLKGYNKGILRLEIHYSTDHDFELRREFCENGKFMFEGIFHKGNAFGPSNSYHCNGQLSSQCIRYNGQNIGIWKTWNEKGKLREEIDHENLEKLDSLPLINKIRS